MPPNRSLTIILYCRTMRFLVAALVLQMDITRDCKADNRYEIIGDDGHVHHTGVVKDIGGEGPNQRHQRSKRSDLSTEEIQ